jgi:hypothetical protein
MQAFVGLLGGALRMLVGRLAAVRIAAVMAVAFCVKKLA